MDKGKMLEEIQEKTEEIKGRAEELHKVIEETIAQKKQQHQEARYIELGAGDSQDKKTVIIKDGYGLVLGGGGGRGSSCDGRSTAQWQAGYLYRTLQD